MYVWLVHWYWYRPAAVLVVKREGEQCFANTVVHLCTRSRLVTRYFLATTDVGLSLHQLRMGMRLQAEDEIFF